MRSIKIQISGTFSNDFLYYTCQFAKLYHIRGEAQLVGKNTMLIYAEGKDSDLDHFLKFCKEGPVGSTTDSIDISTDTLKNYTRFAI